MTKVFISYSRTQLSEVEALSEDLHTGGCDAWIDQELSGGQPWWQKVLAEIRKCDVFMPVLSQRFADSEACRREVQYAQTLGKRMLPVQIEDVSPRLLGAPLAETQWVDYRLPSKQTALLLMRALYALPPAEPLPDPLPPEPEVPVSYLDTLRSRVDNPHDLGRDEQIRLIADLRDRMRGEEADDARLLLRKLRGRSDLLLSTAEEIDRLLQGAGPTAATPPSLERSASRSSTPSASTSPPPEPRTRAPDVAPAQVSGAEIKPNNYVVWAWLSLVAFWPTAILAIVYATQVDKKYGAGDYTGAKKASSNAKTWVTVSVVALVVLIGLAAAANS